jgi:hypothetical protein
MEVRPVPVIPIEISTKRLYELIMFIYCIHAKVPRAKVLGLVFCVLFFVLK